MAGLWRRMLPSLSGSGCFRLEEVFTGVAIPEAAADTIRLAGELSKPITTGDVTRLINAARIRC